jgi:hypothetical protein
MPPDPEPQPFRPPAIGEPLFPPDTQSGLPNKRQVIHAVIFNLVMLCELALALYIADAYRETWDFTLVFVLVFFGAIIPTIVISRQIMKRVLKQD